MYSDFQENLSLRSTFHAVLPFHVFSENVLIYMCIHIEVLFLFSICIYIYMYIHLCVVSVYLQILLKYLPRRRYLYPHVQVLGCPSLPRRICIVKRVITQSH